MTKGNPEGGRSDRRVFHALILQLGREGHPASEVVRAHIAAGHGPVATNTVYTIWARNGLKPKVARYADDIPWVIRQEHLQTYPAQMLRAAARQKRGESNAPDPQKKLDKFLRMLDREGLVVHYDPEDPRSHNGFMYTERREGIDTGLVRSPWFTDRGARILHPAGIRAGARPPWETEDPSPAIDLRGGSPVIDLRSRSRSKV